MPKLDLFQGGVRKGAAIWLTRQCRVSWAVAILSRVAILGIRLLNPLSVRRNDAFSRLM
jgi:hypothetical protein